MRLEDVANFIGLSDFKLVTLPSEEFVTRLDRIIACAQRLARQIPDAEIGGRVIPNRPRTIHTLIFHIFRLPESYLDAWNDGTYFWGTWNRMPEGPVESGTDAADYGERVRQLVKEWWCAVDKTQIDKREIDAYYGHTTGYQLLERTTWHTAQHVRQIAYVLEQLGITPAGPLTTEELQGLPVPERLFE